MAVKISGLINTWNEAETIRYAVESLKSWCDEVLVVDQQSSDDTQRIAAACGAKVIEVESTGYVEIIREMSVAMTEHEWVMVLDSDEVVHPQLGQRLRRIAETGEANVVRIPRRNIILGEEMEHGQWWPNAKRRFFHKDWIDIRVEMHGGFHAAAGATEIMLPMDRDCCLWHFSYHNIADVVWKSQRYTTVQAWQRARRGKRPGPRRWFRVALRQAWKEFVKGRAYKDGPAGIAVSMVRVMDRFLVQAKQWDELASQGRAEQYQRLKEEMLGLEHDPDLAPIDHSDQERLEKAPEAVGEVQF
jgi:glycosyltransferase involved in cell wall biosynthesis